jgi:DNA mismatch repair ATPase MutS
MKVSDSLDKRMSLFYSELNRLKMILENLKTRGRVFFLIDEMLKGTNALDRHEGSKALLRQLIFQGARGILATHDVELTQCHLTFPEEVRNFHFDGSIEGDKLTFDYQLKPGVCESFNALVLMKKMGIDISQ